MAWRKPCPGAENFATGSIQFWLNAFADNPQIGGGFAQGIVNPTIPMIQFGIPYTAGDGERSAMWLRAYGVDAIVASGPATRDAFPGDFRDADKFQGALPELWRSGDDVIYGVPRRSRSLAHVVRAEHIAPRAPLNVEDVEPVLPYVGALEDDGLPIAYFEWERPNRARINAVLSGEHLISVQQSYRSGWRATAQGEPVSIRSDGLGFMILDAPCAGPCEIELVYGGGGEAGAARATSGAAFLALLGWWFWERRKISEKSAQAD